MSGFGGLEDDWEAKVLGLGRWVLMNGEWGDYRSLKRAAEPPSNLPPGALAETAQWGGKQDSF